MEKSEKRIGVGILSLIVFIIGIAFVVQIGGHRPLGDWLLNLVGIRAWSNRSNGIHYTIFYSLFLFAVSLIIGIRYKNDWGGKLGRNLSAFIIFVIVFSMIFLMNW